MSTDALDDDTAVPVRRSEWDRRRSPDEDTVVRPGHPLPGTGMTSPDDAGAPSLVAESASRVVNIIDGDTMILPRRVDRVASLPEPGTPPPAPVPAATPRTAEPVPARLATPRLRLPDGTTVPVDRPVVMGRNPRAARVPSDPPPALITLSSPSREVSASQLAIEAAGDGIVVTDLHSTNGTTVLLPDGSSRALVAGDSVVVPVGTILIMGDAPAVTVLAPVPADPLSAGAGSVAPSGIGGRP